MFKFKKAHLISLATVLLTFSAGALMAGPVNGSARSQVGSAPVPTNKLLRAQAAEVKGSVQSARSNSGSSSTSGSGSSSTSG